MHKEMCPNKQWLSLDFNNAHTNLLSAITNQHNKVNWQKLTIQLSNTRKYEKKNFYWSYSICKAELPWAVAVVQTAYVAAMGRVEKNQVLVALVQAQSVVVHREESLALTHLHSEVDHTPS